MSPARITSFPVVFASLPVVASQIGDEIRDAGRDKENAACDVSACGICRIGTAGFEPTTSCTPSTAEIRRKSVKHVENRVCGVPSLPPNPRFPLFPDFLGTVWGQLGQLVAEPERYSTVGSTLYELRPRDPFDAISQPRIETSSFGPLGGTSHGRHRTDRQRSPTGASRRPCRARTASGRR